MSIDCVGRPTMSVVCIGHRRWSVCRGFSDAEQVWVCYLQSYSTNKSFDTRARNSQSAPSRPQLALFKHQTQSEAIRMVLATHVACRARKESSEPYER